MNKDYYVIYWYDGKHKKLCIIEFVQFHQYKDVDKIQGKVIYRCTESSQPINSIVDFPKKDSEKISLSDIVKFKLLGEIIE